MGQTTEKNCQAIDSTFGVNCIGNTEALFMCLASVLNATVLPKAIQIRFEGALPSFGRFYLEQLSELARFKGVEFIMCVAKSEGVRAARDWQLANCKTDFLWMGDDDVVYAYDCLEQFCTSVYDLQKHLPHIAYIGGVKGDLNNRRGWGNFEMKIQGKDALKDNCNFNNFYDKAECAHQYPRIYTADTGNLFINMAAIRKHGVRFSIFAESLNSGGEDTLFALECGHVGLEAYFAPCAVSYHLEKQVVNFNEHAARVEMVLRAAELRGYAKEHMTMVKQALMPWLPINKTNGKETRK